MVVPSAQSLRGRFFRYSLENGQGVLTDAGRLNHLAERWQGILSTF
jgi:hypothetical protein